MELIVGPNGGVNATITSDTVKASPLFTWGIGDYGAGEEMEVRCLVCKRVLPAAAFHLDHIRPKAVYDEKWTEFVDDVTLRDAAYPNNVSKKYRLHILEPNQRVNKNFKLEVRERITGQVEASRADVDQKTAWENDLSNLQFLCMICNTSKGAKDWEVFSKGAPANPLSSVYDRNMSAKKDGPGKRIAETTKGQSGRSQEQAQQRLKPHLRIAALRFPERLSSRRDPEEARAESTDALTIVGSGR